MFASGSNGWHFKNLELMANNILVFVSYTQFFFDFIWLYNWLIEPSRLKYVQSNIIQIYIISKFSKTILHYVIIIDGKNWMGLCLTINEFVCSQNYFPKQFCSNKNILDIRTQLNEQLRCLDTRLECQQSQLLEIQVTEKWRKLPVISRKIFHQLHYFYYRMFSNGGQRSSSTILEIWRNCPNYLLHDTKNRNWR